MTICLDKEKCTGCQLCMEACPYPGAIVMKEGKAVFTDKCDSCGACLDECPEGAVTIEREKEKTNENNYRGVWIFVEQIEGKAVPVSYELISEGKKLAEKLDTYLGAVILGNKISHLTREAFAYGADTVYLVEDEVLEDYRTDPYSQALIYLIQNFKPEIFLLGATYNGRDLAPRTAAGVSTGLTADCTRLTVNKENRQLIQTRPAYGGNIMAHIICPYSRPQMATVRPKVMEKAEPDYKRKGKIEKVELTFKKEDVSTKIIERISLSEDPVKLEEADIIVAGGKGLGKPEGFNLLRDLAKTLGGAVGASRGTVDAGWISPYHQVGQTGKTVRAKLYIACGISGAVQHLTGMQSSDIIVAVNKDPEAPIFNEANYGIVGDLYEIVPPLIEELKNKKRRNY